MANLNLQLKPFSSLAFPLAVFFFLTFASSLTSADNTLTAYQVLQEYNFPRGVLPEGVTSYKINRETGEFEVDLNGTCSFPIESYQLKYKSRITGVISRNKITNLKGVSVKVLILWLNISEVSRDGNELVFSVGIASADFPIGNFLESPKCGCGFDCDNGGRIKVKLGRFVSAA